MAPTPQHELDHADQTEQTDHLPWKLWIMNCGDTIYLLCLRCAIAPSVYLIGAEDLDYLTPGIVTAMAIVAHIGQVIYGPFPRHDLDMPKANLPYSRSCAVELMLPDESRIISMTYCCTSTYFLGFIYTRRVLR